MAVYPWRARRPYVFNSHRGAWVAEGPATLRERAPSGPAELTLATWNVWFGEEHFAARGAALRAELERADADVLGLQEVTADFLAALLAEPWVREGYRVSEAHPERVLDYTAVLLSRLPMSSLGEQELPTAMDRALVMAEVTVGARRVLVGTVHLESRGENGDTRGEQLAVALPALAEHGADAVLVGDCNFDNPVEHARVPAPWQDAWLALRGADPGYTVDTRRNEMTARHKGKERLVRYDRVFLHSPRGTWRPAAIELLGTTPLPGLAPAVYPSDHFGLRAVLRAP